ncbi:MAG: N-acetylmuramoyl-L-alanine amidase [Rickettsiales bacterium]|jgi:N-acetylmuramoyl-L-alanine amidase|nr:N-acetylmuramoyl-L-alanine amidase [Rickettsiales bacterium]
MQHFPNMQILMGVRSKILPKFLPFMGFFVLLMMFFPVSAFANVLVGYTVRDEDGVTRVDIELTGEPKYYIFSVEKPNRLVLDIAKSRWGVTKRAPTLGERVTNIRYGVHEGGKLRLVLDLRKPVTYDHYVVSAGDDGGTHYTIILEVRDAPEVASLGDKAEFSSSGQLKNTKLPVTQKESVPEGVVNRFVVPPVARRKPILPVKLAPLVVIDPGHGGHDPGAIGSDGTVEKDITLAYGLELREALEATGKYRTKMTRGGDSFIPLNERVRIAREAGGDLFVAIHADSHDNKRTRGLSIYTLSENASDREAARLARHANESEILSGVGSEENEVVGLLIDMVQRDTKNMSASFAEVVTSELGKDITLLGRAHRFAGFRVLTAPDIPSVLIELGYLSNAKEVQLLASRDYREKIVNALVRAIDRHFAL